LLSNKKLLLTILFYFLFVFTINLYANYNDSSNIFFDSVSYDPLTIIGLFVFFITPEDESNLNFLWFAGETNRITANHREIGTGLILNRNRAALTTRLRTYNNREMQNGFFWGVFGLLEWRRMYWFFNENSELTVSNPFWGTTKGYAYHSIGVTGGVETGFRIRTNNSGITIFLGLGIPLFYCFGNLPPQANMREFYLNNILPRSVNIGIRLDSFTGTNRHNNR